VTAGYSYQYFYKGRNNKNRPWLPNDEGVYLKSDTVVTKWESVMVSLFGRLNYSLLDRYLITTTLRYDGTSRFSEKNRWGLFPSFSLAWKINEEAFLADVDFVSQLKLRLGWGITGQQDVGNTEFKHYYPYLAAYQFSEPGASYQRGSQFIETYRPGPYNSDLKWEETVTRNIGLDFGLANNRFTGSIDYYNRESKDLISEIPIAVGTNFSNTLITNIGNLTNKGIEASINAVVLSTTSLRWQIGANFTYNKNEITKLTSYNDSTFLGVDVGDISGGVDNKVQKHMIGYPAYTFFLFKQVYDVDGMPVEGLYVDKTGSGGEVSGNNANKYYMDNPAPDYVIGINTSLEYKNFDFSFSGRANIGNYVYNNNNSNRALYQNVYNQSGYLANIPKSVEETEFQTAQYWSDIYLENASFFRMDNISVGYTFNKLVTERLTGRVFLTVSNAFVITKYSGLDPEISNGIDRNIYPRPRTFILGLNIDF
jgi:iron complex outermembrane receptor protein